MSQESFASSEASKKQDENDEELDQLLDSALQDFDKPNTPPEAPPKLAKEESSDCNAEQLWNDEFLLDAQKKLEDNMKALFDHGNQTEASLDQFEQDLHKMANEAKKLQQLILSERSPDPNFSETIAETLRNLSENSENIQNNLGEDINAMLGGLNLGGSDGSPDMLPFMQNMMQLFLSKDVLYPGIQDIVEKYPEWLDGKKDSLSKEEYDNYEKQLKIMKDVCTEFEKETSSDSDDTKKARFAKILSLMEEMQNLGQPPKELIGEGNLFFDEKGLPNQIPGLDPSQCSVM